MRESRRASCPRFGRIPPRGGHLAGVRPEPSVGIEPTPAAYEDAARPSCCEGEHRSSGRRESNPLGLRWQRSAAPCGVIRVRSRRESNPADPTSTREARARRESARVNNPAPASAGGRRAAQASERSSRRELNPLGLRWQRSAAPCGVIRVRVVPPAGVAPAPCRLRIDCSPFELRRQCSGDTSCRRTPCDTCHPLESNQNLPGFGRARRPSTQEWHVRGARLRLAFRRIRLSLPRRHRVADVPL